MENQKFFEQKNASQNLPNSLYKSIDKSFIIVSQNGYFEILPGKLPTVVQIT